MSRLTTSRAFLSMNSRRGSTASPIKMVKISSAPTASSMVTLRRVRLSGVIVVSAHEPRAPPVDLGRDLGDGGGDLGVPYPALRALELLPQQAVEDGRGHPAPGELAEERAELERALQRLEEGIFLQGIGLARDLDGRLLHPLGEQELLHLA